MGGGGHWGVTTMKRCDEDCGHWAVDHWRGWGGGHWRGWWSLGGGGWCSRGGVHGVGVVVVTGGAHNEVRGENAKNEEEEDHSEDRR